MKKKFFAALENIAVVVGYLLRLWGKRGTKANVFAIAGVFFVVVGVGGLTTPDVGRMVLGAFLLFAAWRHS